MSSRGGLRRCGAVVVGCLLGFALLPVVIIVPHGGGDHLLRGLGLTSLEQQTSEEVAGRLSADDLVQADLEEQYLEDDEEVLDIEAYTDDVEQEPEAPGQEGAPGAAEQAAAEAAAATAAAPIAPTAAQAAAHRSATPQAASKPQPAAPGTQRTVAFPSWNSLKGYCKGRLVQKLPNQTSPSTMDRAVSDVFTGIASVGHVAMWKQFQADVLSRLPKLASSKRLKILIVKPLNRHMWNATVDMWRLLSASRSGDEFKLALFYHDLAPEELPDFSEVDPNFRKSIALQKGGKGCKPNFWQEVSPGMAADYDYLWLMDGDLLFDYFKWDLFRYYLVKFQPLVQQPAILPLEPGKRSTDHRALRMRLDKGAQMPAVFEAGWLEMMSSLVSSKVWPLIHARARVSTSAWPLEGLWNVISGVAWHIGCQMTRGLVVNVSPVRHANCQSLKKQGGCRKKPPDKECFKTKAWEAAGLKEIFATCPEAQNVSRWQGHFVCWQPGRRWDAWWSGLRTMEVVPAFEARPRAPWSAALSSPAAPASPTDLDQRLASGQLVFVFLFRNGFAHPRVWRAFFQGTERKWYQAFAHCVDHKACQKESSVFDELGVELIETAPSRWCKDAVTPAFRLLQRALAADPQPQGPRKYVLVSETTVPLRRLVKMRTVLLANDVSDICPSRRELWPTVKSRGVKRGLVKHSQWAVLSRRDAEAFVQGWQKVAKYKVEKSGSYFESWSVPFMGSDGRANLSRLVPRSQVKPNQGRCPDEEVFTAVIFGMFEQSMISRWEHILSGNGCRTWLRWRDRKPILWDHLPRALTRLLMDGVDSQWMFARKFSAGAQIDELIPRIGGRVIMAPKGMAPKLPVFKFPGVPRFKPQNLSDPPVRPSP